MVGSLRFAVAAFLSFLAAGCAGTTNVPGGTIGGQPQVSIETPDEPVQCVPFAREHSGISLFGDAGSWWDEAAGRYARSGDPKIGSVLVLTGYAGPHRGHLAVVTAIDTPRQIRIDHANWMNDGRIYRNDPVIDVSPDNDWSEVRVWNPRDQVLGSRTYLVRGFIGPDRERDSERIASRE